MYSKLSKIGVLVIASMIIFVMITGTASAATYNFNHDPTESQYYSGNPSIMKSANGDLHVVTYDNVKWENILHNRVNTQLTIYIGGIGQYFGISSNEYSTTLGGLATFDDKPLGNYTATVVNNQDQWIQAYHVYKDGLNQYSISDSHLMTIGP